MLLSRCLVIGIFLVPACSAQLPDYYKAVNRVTWVVENIDRVRPAWEAMGFSDVREHPNIQLVGEFRSKPATIYAWQITARLGNLAVDMIQPAEGQANAYTNFLAKHGDGIFSIVHEAGSRPVAEDEIRRLQAKGVAVLQQVTVQRDRVPVTYTYFDTEPEGTYAVGLVYAPGGMRAASGPPAISHFGWVVWDGAAVSTYWERLGWPAFSMQRATPRCRWPLQRQSAFAYVRSRFSTPHAVPL
jgi:hypothetical protein